MSRCRPARRGCGRARRGARPRAGGARRRPRWPRRLGPPPPVVSAARHAIAAHQSVYAARSHTGGSVGFDPFLHVRWTVLGNTNRRPAGPSSGSTRCRSTSVDRSSSVAVDGAGLGRAERQSSPQRARQHRQLTEETHLAGLQQAARRLDGRPQTVVDATSPHTAARGAGRGARRRAGAPAPRPKAPRRSHRRVRAPAGDRRGAGTAPTPRRRSRR